MKPTRSLGWVVWAISLVLAAGAAPLDVPDWARPGSATHQQVPPPAGFHRPSVVFPTPLGIFAGQADVGGPLLPGSASFDPATGAYTLTSASYNIWYFRDEFRFAWTKVAWDLSLAADVSFPVPGGYDDRKAVLIVRQDLDDNSREVMVALHGAGLIHLASRNEKGADIKESCRLQPAKRGTKPLRLGLERQGDRFQLWVSVDGEPMHPVGDPAVLVFPGPVYVGLGFCSHVPDKADTAVLSHVVLENVAGRVR